MSRVITSPHPQGSPEWLADRAGRLNGSEVAAIFATIAKGEAAARADLRYKLVLERLTGKAEPSGYTSAEMVWGTEQEPHARMAFEMANELTVTESGYCYLPEMMAGVSPDGFVTEGGRLGIVEFKCPKSRTHLGYIDAGVIPKIYIPQVEHTMWITGAEFAYFQSFDPRFPEKLQRFQTRMERDEKRIEAHEKAVLQFLLEADDLEKQLRLRAA
jgi:predicted phage-related endonuclease